MQKKYDHDVVLHWRPVSDLFILDVGDLNDISMAMTLDEMKRGWDIGFSDV